MKRLSSLFAAMSLVVLALLVALPSTAALAGGGDCFAYNPASLYVVPQGDHYLLTNGSAYMQILDNATDAAHALTVAQRYQYQCWVGRDNVRPEHIRYVTEYWGLSSGLPTTAFSEDCIGFNPATLTVVQNGSDWFVMSGNMSMSQFASQQDAQWMVNIIVGNGWTQQCFIGRDNHRADRLNYIMEYWKAAGTDVISSGVISVNPAIIKLVPTRKP